MNAIDLFQKPVRKYRKSINPPYTKKDLLVVGLTLFLLLAIPLTVISIYQSREIHSRASTLPIQVTFQNGKLYVDGQKFEIRGVNYNPTGIDTNQLDPLAPSADVAKIAALGANTIGTYFCGKAEYAQWSDLTIGQSFYNNLYPAAEAYGLKLIVGYYSNETIDWTNTTRLAKVTAQYQELVTAAKSRPSTLAYLIGNEIFEKLANDTQKNAYAKWIGDMVVWTHANDPLHPVMYSDRGDQPALSFLKTYAPLLDIYGVNNYSFTSSSSLTSIVTNYANSWVGKPIFLHEWGSDSLNVATGTEDQAQQSSRYQTLATAISQTYTSSTSPLIGATSFEITDEWRFVGSSSTQDKDSGWACASCFDGKANEDYWGLLTAVNAGSASSRNYKSAYYGLQSFWQGTTPPPPPIGDTTPPTVMITYPIANTTITGKVNIIASATDNVAVTKVEFYVDSKLVRTDTASPYNYTWDPRKYTIGSHTITAKAYDGARNTTSNSISLIR